MGIFKFFSSRIPSKPRNKDLQTTGSVSVNVQKNVGMRTENASTIVQNVIAPENRKGKITITDLLQIPVAEIGANDTYLVYSSGSDEAGWHTGGQFEYDGELYDDGTFFLWSIDRWVAVYKDNQTEEKQPTLFNPLQKFVSLISKTYSQSSYDNLPGRVKAGIPIAEVRNYELDEAGVYQEKKESQTGSQSAETNVKTLVVPYARSYTQGGEMVYEGGALTAADYERLCKGGSGDYVDLTSSQHISGDKTFTFFGLKENNQGDGGSSIAFYDKNGELKFLMGFDEGDEFPTVSMFDSQWHQRKLAYEGDFAMSVLFDGKFYYANNGIIDLSNASIATRTWVNQQGYATQSWVEGKGYITADALKPYATMTYMNTYVNDNLSALQLQIERELTDYATQNWVNQQGFLKSVPSSYATQSWVQSNFALKTDVPTKLSDIQNDSNLYVSNIYISDISAQGSWVKYAFSANLVDTGGVPLKAGDYLLNGTQLWRVDLIGGNVGYCINEGVQIMPTIPKSDYVRFEQSGQYASYTFSTTASRGATLSSRTSSTSGTNNLHICVHITGLTTTAEYNVYLLTHRVSLVFCGKDSSGNVIQMEALRNVSINQIGTDVFFIIQIESGKVFDPSSYPNTFNVVFEPID